MTSKKPTSKALPVAAGITGLALAGLAAGYFLYGKEAPKRRKKVTSWMLRAKADIMDSLAKAKDMSEPAFNAAIETGLAKYTKDKNIAADEIMMFGRDLRKHWRDIKAEIMPAAKKTTTKSAKKPVAKSTKKVAKKTVKK